MSLSRPQGNKTSFFCLFFSFFIGSCVHLLSYKSLFLLPLFSSPTDTPRILRLNDATRNSSAYSSPPEPPTPVLAFETSESPPPRPVSKPISPDDEPKSPEPTSEIVTSNPTLPSLEPEPVAAKNTPLPTPHTVSLKKSEPDKSTPTPAPHAIESETSDPTSTPPSDMSTPIPTPHAIESETSDPTSTPPSDMSTPIPTPHAIELETSDPTSTHTSDMSTPTPTPHAIELETSDPTSTHTSDTSTPIPTPHTVSLKTSDPTSTPPNPTEHSRCPSLSPTSTLNSPKPEAKNLTQKPNLFNPSPIRSANDSSRPTHSIGSQITTEPLSSKPESINPTQVTDRNFPTFMPIDESHSATPQAKFHTEAPFTSPTTSKPNTEDLSSTPTVVIKTKKPKSIPAGGLTYDPTPYPTLSPKPSVQPSAQPSYPLQVSKMIRNIVMVFDDCEWLGPSSVNTWVGVTEEFIVSEIMKTADEKSIQYLNCNIFFRKQFVPAEDFNSDNAARQGRHLQSSPLAIQFDQQFELRSSMQSHPYQMYLIETLDTEEKQSNYINQLQSAGDPIFNSINIIKVLLDGRDISQPSTVTSIPKPSNIGPVAGIAVSIFFGSILTAVSVILLRHKKYKSKAKNAFSTDGGSIYIDVAANSPDVSTLGPPTGTYISQSMRFEDVTVGER
jgi:hypothetical protein